MERFPQPKCLSSSEGCTWRASVLCWKQGVDVRAADAALGFLVSQWHPAAWPLLQWVVLWATLEPDTLEPPWLISQYLGTVRSLSSPSPLTVETSGMLPRVLEAQLQNLVQHHSWLLPVSAYSHLESASLFSPLTEYWFGFYVFFLSQELSLSWMM